MTAARSLEIDFGVWSDISLLSPNPLLHKKTYTLSNQIYLLLTHVSVYIARPNFSILRAQLSMDNIQRYRLAKLTAGFSRPLKPSQPSAE